MQPKKSVEDAGQSNAEVFAMPAAPAETEPKGGQADVSEAIESSESTPSKHERNLSDPEQRASAKSPTLPSPTSSQTVQIPPAQQPANQPVQHANDDSPQIADDVDVIEKEWVDKAKQIIDQTRNHPYRQEEEVERLQQSYLKKRYGKDVSSAS